MMWPWGGGILWKYPKDAMNTLARLPLAGGGGIGGPSPGGSDGPGPGGSGGGIAFRGGIAFGSGGGICLFTVPYCRPVNGAASNCLGRLLSVQMERRPAGLKGN